MRQIINSRFEFVQYCLRKLGAPVIRINITEQQIDDRVNDALDMFLQFHMDGSYRGVHVHQITQEDIDAEKISELLPICAMFGGEGVPDSFAFAFRDIHHPGIFFHREAQ
jgi:hypothetical protein